jgi:hypothetical protein
VGGGVVTNGDEPVPRVVVTPDLEAFAAALIAALGMDLEVEPAPCADCGRDTAPELPDAVRLVQPPEPGSWEWYMVTAEVWAEAGMEPDGGYLCIGCLERRLGRRLVPADFPAWPVNERDPLDTARLAERKGQR